MRILAENSALAAGGRVEKKVSIAPRAKRLISKKF
jgi:hypothetical protein